jgi:hypothetical protein
MNAQKLSITLLASAWAMWQSFAGHGQEHWDLWEAFETKAKCEGFADYMEQQIKAGKVPGFRWDGKAIMSTKVPGVESAFFCYPEAIDPRGPKAK